MFGFSIEEEIELFEESATILKSKSQRENSTNQRLTQQANKSKSKRNRKGIKYLERQSNYLNVKKTKRNKAGSIQKQRIQKQRIQKQIDKRKLLEINWHKDVLIYLIFYFVTSSLNLGIH